MSFSSGSLHRVQITVPVMFLFLNNTAGHWADVLQANS